MSYTVEKEGYGSYLSPDVFGPEGSTYIRLLPTDDWMAKRHDQVGSPYPMRFTGTIFLTSDLAGVTFDLVGATGEPFYVDEDFNWRTDLTETTSVGTGGFTEVGPGRYQVKIGEPAVTCAPRLAWPDGPTSLRLPVREGYLTSVHMQCQP